MNEQIRGGTSRRASRPASARPGTRAAEDRRRLSRSGEIVPGLHAFVDALEVPERRAEILAGVVRAASATRVPERVALHLVDLAFDWFGGAGWAVVTAAEARGARWLAERGVPSTRRSELADLARLVMRRGHVEWLVSSAPGRQRKSLAVGIPLRSRGRLVAVLLGVDAARSRAAELPDARKGQYDAVLELTDAVAAVLDVTLRLKRANTLSQVDDLTGLYNARFLAQALKREVKRAQRTGRPLSILFVDLDGFKGINDRYGHLCGSRAILEAAHRIHAGARETDVVARFGGDEFAIILPETGREGAMVAARRVRERVAGEPFLAEEGIRYRLTASVGAATMPGAAATPDALLAAADAAMYRVKDHGKDGIEMADSPPGMAAPRR